MCTMTRKRMRTYFCASLLLSLASCKKNAVTENKATVDKLQTLFVLASDGLNIRNVPSLLGKKIGIVPNFAKVEIDESGKIPEMLTSNYVNGIGIPIRHLVNGYWVKIKGKSLGYVHTGYLTKFNPADLYNEALRKYGGVIKTEFDGKPRERPQVNELKIKQIVNNMAIVSHRGYPESVGYLEEVDTLWYHNGQMWLPFFGNQAVPPVGQFSYLFDINADDRPDLLMTGANGILVEAAILLQNKDSTFSEADSAQGHHNLEISAESCDGFRLIFGVKYATKKTFSFDCVTGKLLQK